MDSALSFGGGYSLDPVDSGFVFKLIENPRSRDFYYIFINRNGLEAFLQSVTGIHPGQLLRPELGFVSSGCATNLKIECLGGIHISRLFYFAKSLKAVGSFHFFLDFLHMLQSPFFGFRNNLCNRPLLPGLESLNAAGGVDVLHLP